MTTSTPATDTEPALAVRDLRVFAGERELVHGSTFQIARGERVGLIGESGSGKSLTAFSAIGLLAPGLRATGDVRLRGVDENIVDAGESTMSGVRGRIASVVFQEPMTALNPLMTVGDQIAEVMMLHKTVPDRRSASAAALELMTQVRLPDPSRMFGRYPHELSGGQRQRVVLAIALANDPDLLICDEPTTALDVTVQAQMLELIGDLVARHHSSLLFISHDLAVVADVCDRILVMLKGEIVEEGPVEQVLSHPQHPYTRALLAASNLKDVDASGRLLTVQSAADRVPAAPEAPPTHAPAASRAGATRSAAHQVLEAEESVTVFNEAVGDNFIIRARDLTRVYPGAREHLFGRRRPVHALDGVSFDVRPGERFGIVGESGSGKSTLIRLLAGLDHPTSGVVEVAGVAHATATRAERRALRDQVAMVFQDPMASLDPRMSIRDIVTEPLRGTRRADAHHLAAELIRAVGLDADALRLRPHQFSGGQRQRISIARALIKRPRILIADEPVSALDVSVRAQVLNLIADLAEQYSLTVVFVSHDLGVVRHVCDTVAVVSAGRILECGPIDAVYESPRHEYTRRLVDSTPDLAAAIARRHASVAVG